MLKRILIVLLILAALVAGTGWLFMDKIAARALDAFARQNLGNDVRDRLPDGLHVFFCGTGSPMPDPTRGPTCNGVIAGDRVFMVDAGSGGTRNLVLTQFPAAEVERVFLTHLHSDHIDGLPEVKIQTWIGGGRSEPLPVSGPRGVTIVTRGFNMTFTPDRHYRQAHQPDLLNPDGFGLVGEVINFDGGSAVILDEGDLRITAFNVSHAPVEPAFGYRIDYKDRSVVFSGDTAFDPNLVRVSSGADLLVHEAQSAEMLGILERVAEERGETRIQQVFKDIIPYHTTPQEAARAAQEAGVQELVLNHITPPLPSRLFYGLFLGDANDRFDGPITIAEDRMIISLPSGSDDIVHGS